MASLHSGPTITSAPTTVTPAAPSPPSPPPPLPQVVLPLKAVDLRSFSARHKDVVSYFVAGGCAGAASRTVVSPLERLKIILQVQPRGTGQALAYTGVWGGLAKMYREEGLKGFMRGNGVNCVRIIPYSAVQFTTYEFLKKFFTNYGERKLDTPTRLVAGGLAGITSVCTTYPLDLIRARLSIASASLAFGGSTVQQKIPGMWGMMAKVYREEGGLRGLYKGIMPTAFGVAPYVGINFAAYEALRQIITPPDKQTTFRKLTCGALAGTISQTCTYPLDVLRRKMQVTGMKDGVLGVQYSSAMGAVFSIVKTEGFIGLYRGLWPNLLKVAPSIATSFFVYETVKEALGAK